MNSKLSFFAFFVFSVFSLRAAVVDTLSVYSPAMKKNVQVVVISPEKRQSLQPVVYLLHGHGGNAHTWLSTQPGLPDIAERDGMIFVCPDGKDSWYWDSPKDSSYRYETFVAGELISYIDSLYLTRKDRSGRAIAGLSMGGHGAMWLSFRHKDVFGAAGSTSGGLDIRPFPNSWNMSKQLGKKSENPEVWEAHTVINQIDRIQDGDLALIIDCGYDDFFFQVNNDFHQKLLANKIGHDFLVRPGGHTRDYWNNSIEYQLLFFKKFFEKGK